MITIKIDGYTADVDPDMGDGATGCWVSKVCNVDGSGEMCSASLQALEAGGFLTDGQGGDVEPVHEKTLAKIAAWAEENGY